jgi:hypothetical protein
MQPLSQQLADLSAQAKKAEERFTKAQAETKDRIEQQRQEVRQEAEGALNRVKEGVARASDGTKSHFAQLKSKVDGDMQRLNERASADSQKVEAWQANNYADDKAADAQAAVGYAIAAVKMAEIATLDAVEARGRAEIKAEQTQPINA